MAIVSDIEIRLRADIARLQQDMNAARRSVDGAMGGITNAVTLAKRALAGLGVGMALKELASQVIGSQREFDKLNSSLITAVGSSQAAGSAFKALQAFAASTPYSVSEATEAFIKLRNLGLSPSEKALNAYGNTAAAMGKGLNQMIEAVADAATGEFERLKEFGIKSKANGDQVMFTFQGVTKSIGNNAKDIEKYLMQIGEVEFAGAMERRANTLDGAISNLGDTWQSVMRAISSNGFGEGVMGGVLALSGALTDLAAIIDTVGGAAHKEGEQVKEASGLHAALTTTFEAVAVLGVNVAYVLTQVGKELGGLAAQATVLAKGDFAGARAIGVAMRAEAEADRKAVDEKTKAILGSAEKAQVARTKEEAERKASGTDRLAAYGKEISAEEKRNQAKMAVIDIENKLNGVNKETVADLAKLKVALDTGAITQAEYNKYAAKTNLDAAKNTTAYKDQVRALDMSTAAIERRAAAQAFDNKQTLDRLAFENRTGQLNDEDHITARGAAEVKAIQNSKTALEAQLAVEAKRLDNREKMADLSGKIKAADKEIAARGVQTEHELFELEQKRYREAIGHTADRIEAAQQERDAQKKTTQGMQDEIEALGLTGRQLAEVTAARLRDQAAALDRRASIGLIEEENAALSAQAEELRKQADLGLTKERVQTQQKFWGDIEQTAHDTFVSIGKDGGSAFQRLKDSAKNMFFDWLYQMTLKKWIVNIQAETSTSSSGGSILDMFSDNSSSSGGADWTAMGAKLFGGFKGGFSSLTGGGGASTGTSGAGTASGSTGAFGAASSTAGAYAAAALIGQALGNAISKGYATNLMSSKAMVNWSTFLSPVPILGGLVGGLVNRAFGRGAKEFEPTTLNGSLGGGGFNGTFDTAWKQKGGWFHSDRSGVDKTAVDAATANSLMETYAAIQTATAGFAKVLGVNADAIMSRTQTLNIALGKDEAANQKAIADFFTGVGDTLAAVALPSVAQFQAQGETAATTLQRLAANFAGVNAIMNTVGLDVDKVFGAVGIASLGARERLLTLIGGLDGFASKMQFFTENFLDESEQIAIIQKPLQEQLAALGFAGITTAEQFKTAVQGLVSSGALATESGAAQYAGLLALAPQFKTVSDYLKGIAEASAQEAKDAADVQVQTLKDASDKAKTLAHDRRDLEIQIMDAQGNATGALAARREIELDSVDDSLRGLYKRLYALQDEKVANEAAADAAQKTADVLKAVKDAAAAAMQAFGNSVVDAMDRATLAAKAIRDFSDSLNLGALSPLDPDARYREAQRQYSAADPKDTAAATAFLQASKDRGADSIFYQRDFAEVQKRLAGEAVRLDDYVQRLPEFYRRATEPAPVKVATPAADMTVMTGHLEKISAKIGQLADQFDGASNGGQGLKTLT